MKNQKYLWTIFTLTIIFFSFNVFAQELVASDSAEVPHNCRMYGAISSNFPDNMLYQNLVSDSSSLKALSATSNINGWGVITYPEFNSNIGVTRGPVRAYNDQNFTEAVISINSSEPNIVLAHIRACTSGCCAPTEQVNNPHPFIRYSEPTGKTWTFEHNGGVTKSSMINLIGSSYLNSHAPFGSEVSQCSTSDYTSSLVVDSELYFLYVLKMIEENDGDALLGISTAIKNMIAAGQTGGINFIMSDGETVYGFRRGMTLSYKYDLSQGYSIVASQPTNNDGSWITMSDYNLVILKEGVAPVLIPDIRTYVAPSVNISNPNPANNSQVSSMSQIEFTITEANNNKMNYTFTTSPNIGSRTGINVNNGVISVPVSGLVSGTTYTWHVSLTNGMQTDEKDFTFYYYVPQQAPVITVIYPAEGDTLTTAPTQISFNLNDPNNNRMNYTVTTSPDVGSRTGTNILNGVQTVSVSGLVPGNYVWTVTATDGVLSSTEEFSFNYQGSQGDVIFNNVYPGNQNANYNPRLSVNIIDPQNAPLTVIFETNKSAGSWEEIGRYENGRNGVYTYDTSGMDVKNNRYYWRVKVYDGTAWTTQTYVFTAQPFALKWSYNTGVESSLSALAVDVNKDGIYEIFTTGEDELNCLDGATGRVLWTYTNTQILSHSPIEIHDLNNDDIPEIVVAANARTIALHANNGSLYWNVPVESEDHHIVIVDIEGNGYPYVYVTSEDITQLENGTGRLRKLNGTNGNVLAEVFSWRPCWGGLSADDVNNDGKFEIYMTDRKANYTVSAPGLGKGMQAYDADTLELLWFEDDITCSSHTMGLIDVNNDNVRDAVAVQQNGGGIYVIDGATGVKMPGKWANSLGVSGHSQFSIWDIDNDGNLELITSNNDVAKVWDIGRWSLDASLIEFPEPPKMADVIGDSDLEIIGHKGNIVIYDGNYNNIENISSTNLGSLSGHSIVQDIDDDGRNELIIVSYWGLVQVFDTSAYAPTQKVRTNALCYSERRLGAGVYVPPLGAPQPFIKDGTEFPKDNSENVSLNPELSFNAVDYRYDLLDIEISTDASGSWKTVATFDNVPNGRYSYTPSDMDDGGVTYNWKVTVKDTNADNLVATKTFSFTTQETSSWSMTGWNYKKQVTIDHTKVSADLTNFPVLVEFTDSNLINKTQVDADDIIFTSEDGTTKLAHEIESYDSLTGHIVAWVNVPELSSTKDTIIFMYYGNPDVESQQNSEGVWDSNYLAVHHLEETEGLIIDSTINNNDGTALNGVVLNSAGKIDGGDRFDGVNDRTQLTQAFSNQTAFTFEGWMNTANKQGYLVSQRDLSSRGSFIQHNSNGLLQFYVNNVYIQRATSINAWHYVVGTFDGSSVKLYIDGNLGASGSSTITWPAESLYIGDRAAGSRNFQGSLDEIRLSDVARSEAYIKTSFANQNSPSTFISVGSEESAATKPVISNAVPANEEVEVPLNLSEISFDLFDNQGDLMSYTLTTSPNIGSASANNVPNGHYAVSVSGLNASTTYTWYLNVSDGDDWTRKTYTFTAKFECVDADGDGYNVTGGICGLVDCNDANVNVHPNALDVCGNGIDEDCSGSDEECATLLKDSTFESSTDNADLRLNSVGQDWYESRVNVPALLTLDVSDVAGNSGKKAKFDASSTGNAYLSQEFGELQSGNFSVEWDIYVDSILDISSPDRAGWMLVGDDSVAGSGPNANNNERFVYMAFFKNGGATNGTMDLIAVDRDDTFSAFTTVASNLSLKQWYNIRVDLNLDADTYDVFVDGVFQKTVTSRMAKTNVTHISFAQWNDGAGSFYVDNVKEYNMPVCIPSEEVCDGLDNDCDGQVDEGDVCVVEVDNDNDGFNSSVDCNDNNSAINPNATEICGNGIDEDCSGSDLACEPVPVDEICNDTIDNDLDGSIDCGDSDCASFLACQNLCGNSLIDVDIYHNEECDDGNFYNNDGCSATCYVEENWTCSGVPSVCEVITNSCGGADLNKDTVVNLFDLVILTENFDRTDCNSGNNYCNGADINKDGSVNSSDLRIFTPNFGMTSCDLEECIPSEEVCDGLDNDCDGQVDEGDVCVVEVDNDNDGFNSSVDCNDNNSAINPNATEICDGIDNDCSGAIDDNLVSPLAPLQEGVCINSTLTCQGMFGWVADYSSITGYELEEISCDLLDNDCDSEVDEGNICPVTYILADSAFDLSNDSADLRLNGVGQDWYESRGQAPALLTLDVSDVGGNSGKKAKFDASSTTNAYMSQEFREPQNGNFSVEWDIYVDSILDISSPDRAGWMLVGDDSVAGNGPNANNNERFVYMAFLKNGGGTNGTMDLVAVNRTGSFTVHEIVASGLNIDQWYNIRVDLNLDADTYDVYVDSVFQKTVTSRMAKTSVTHISFAQWNDGAGAFYVDNVNELVYTPVICTDADNDGYFVEGGVCGLVDCNDANINVNYGVTEICDGIDNDCSGAIDDNLVSPLAPLQEGVCANSTLTCNGASGWLANYNLISGYELEETSCDLIDNDCDGEIDENCSVASVCGNGVIESSEFCDDNNTIANDGCSDVCAVESGYTCIGDVLSVCTLDCVASEEVCDGLDNDCDGQVDEGNVCVVEVDNDNDGFNSSLDCNDNNSEINPNATEICDLVDNNCDLIIDDIPAQETSCGIGYCAQTGLLQCVDGNLIDSCVAGDPILEICGNGIDDDCNGFDDVCPVTYILADSAFDLSSDSADLRANGEGQDWYESRVQTPTLASLDESTIGTNSGKKLKLNGTTVSTQNAYLTQEFIQPQSNDFSVEWDLFIESIYPAAPYRTGMTLIGDNSVATNIGPNSDNNERFVYMGFSSYNKSEGKMDLVVRDRDDGFNAGLFTIVATDLNIGQWYNIRVDMNLTTDTYDIYVDDVFQKTVTSRVAKSSLTHISFAHWNDGAGSFYVDNVYSPALN